MIKYVWLVLIAGSLIGCSDDGEGPSASNAVNYQCYVPQLSCDIEPLAAGNRWTRFTFTYDSAGNVTDTSILIDHIDADTTVDHETWYLWLPPEGFPVPGWWYINRNDGLWSGASPADSRLI